MARIRGRNIDLEHLWGTDQNDQIIGRGGVDVLIGLGGNDRLDGGNGDDFLVADAGRDVLIGGKGADRFIAADGREGDVIKDFNFRQDVLDLVPLGVRSRRQLDFEKSGDSITVTFKQHSITVEGDMTVKQLARSIDYADRLKINFENLKPTARQVFDSERLDEGASYKGFEWNNWGVMNAPAYGRDNDSGYKAASGKTLLYNRGNAVIDQDEPFDFESFKAAGAWRDNLKVVVTAITGGREIGSQTFTLGKAGKVRKYELDDDIFDAVGRVEIATYGGDRNERTDFDWVQAAFDDFELFV